MKLFIRQLFFAVTFLSSSSIAFAALPHVNAVNGAGFGLDDGRLIIFHGVNEMNKQSPYTPSSIGFNDIQARFIQQHGFNLVRLGVFWAGIEPTETGSGKPPIYNDAYLANIKSTIEMLANYGIYTFVDFHQDAYSNILDKSNHTVGLGEPTWTDSSTPGFPNVGFPLNLFGGGHAGSDTITFDLDNNYDGFWNNKTLADGRFIQDAYAQMIAHTAQYLKGTNGLIGYEIMNEPFPGSDWAKCATVYKETGLPKDYAVGCAIFEQGPLMQLYNTVIPAINAADPTALVLFEPVVFVDADAPVNLPQFSGNNLVFSYHDYNKQVTTPIDNADKYANSHQQLPQMMTEFGGIDGDKPVSEIVQHEDARAQSWTYWAYSNNPIFKFVAGSPDPIKQGLVLDMKKPLTGDNVRTLRLDILTRIYPQIVAGKSPQFSYDLLTREFNFTYVVGTRGGRTQIFLPTLPPIYKRYYVQLSGTGRVAVVDSGNPQLIWLDNVSPGTVKVKITAPLLSANKATKKH